MRFTNLASFAVLFAKGFGLLALTYTDLKNSSGCLERAR